ncbi:hypothetical protein DXG01_007852 [Tephrocybe rancida]|nr:hypothetical protein DXG01_007852 [Tephrocybe rancida]
MVSTAFGAWAPHLHAHYAQNKKACCAWNDQLKHSTGCVFATFVQSGSPNLMHKHKDAANLSCGRCCVTSLGTFDPTRGGHAILWDLGLVEELPPRRSLFLASAPVEHSNESIHRDETRLSHYSTGSLFQFVERGMKGQLEFEKGLSAEQLGAAVLKDEGRWKFGLSLFSTRDELKALSASPQ